MSKYNNARGITLVELMIVVAILGLLVIAGIIIALVMLL